MENTKLHRKKYKSLMLLMCCLTFVFLVIGAFIIYQYRLNERFHTILTNELGENTREHKEHIELVVSNLQGLLDMLQGMPDTQEAIEYAVTINGGIQDDRVQLDYLEADQVMEVSSSEALSESGKELCRQLLAGEEVITELGEDWFTDQDSRFALLRPVSEDGSVSGVLRVQIEASLLAEQDVGSASFFQKVYIIFTKQDGSVVYADTPYPEGSNFFSSAVKGGIASEEMQSVQRDFEKNQKGNMSFYGKGNKYYISWESLDFNEWRVVWFGRSPDVILQSTTILKGLIVFGICLIVLTVIFCATLIQILLRQKRQLNIQQRRYEALAQFNDTVLFEYDAIHNQVTFTPNVLEQLDLDEQCLEGISGTYYMQHLLCAEDRQEISKLFEPASIVLDKMYYVEARFRCRDGEYRWFGCQFKSIENQKGCTTRVVGKLVNINRQRGREQVLRQAALADVLTGVYNRAAESMIDEQLKKDGKGLFFMLDLDDFKNVNDTYGHAAGDELLIGVAQILKEVFRPDDIVARVGGDEFVAFLSGTDDPRVAEHKALAIQRRMEQLYISGTGETVSASIGAASAPRDGSSYEELTAAADRAMYSIKQKSKKGFALHNRED